MKPHSKESKRRSRISSILRSKQFRGFLLGIVITVALLSPFIFLKSLQMRQVGTYYSNDQLVYNALWSEVYDEVGNASDTCFVYVLSYETLETDALLVRLEYNELAFSIIGVVIDIAGEKTYITDVSDGYTTTFYDVGSTVVRIIIFGEILQRSGLIYVYTTPVG